MGYCHIIISEDSSNLYTVILPWGKYCYKHVPMGVRNSSYIFQQKMNNLFHGFEFIYAYIDNPLIPLKIDWTYHVTKLKLNLKNLK